MKKSPDLSQTKNSSSKKSTKEGASVKQAAKQKKIKEEKTGKANSKSGKISTTAKVKAPKPLKLSREQKAFSEKLEFIQALAKAGAASYESKEFEVSFFPGFMGAKPDVPKAEDLNPVDEGQNSEQTSATEETGEDSGGSDTLVTDPEKFEQEMIDSHLGE